MSSTTLCLSMTFFMLKDSPYLMSMHSLAWISQTMYLKFYMTPFCLLWRGDFLRTIGVAAAPVPRGPFKAARPSLSIEDGRWSLCRGDLLVLPLVLWLQVMKAVHDDVHCGTMATCNRLKLEAWWPEYCNNVERYVGKCAQCVKSRPLLQKHTHT